MLMPEDSTGVMAAPPPTWEEVSADPRYTAQDTAGKLDTLNLWASDVEDHTRGQPGYDRRQATGYIEARRAEIEAAKPLSEKAGETLTGAAKSIVYGGLGMAASAAETVAGGITAPLGLQEPGQDFQAVRALGARMKQSAQGAKTTLMALRDPAQREIARQLDEEKAALRDALRHGEHPQDEAGLRDWLAGKHERIVSLAAARHEGAGTNAEQAYLADKERDIAHPDTQREIMAFIKTRDPRFFEAAFDRMTTAQEIKTAQREREAITAGWSDRDREILDYGTDPVELATTAATLGLGAGAVRALRGAGSKARRALSVTGKLAGGAALEGGSEALTTILENPDATEEELTAAAKEAALQGLVIGVLGGGTKAGYDAWKARRAPGAVEPAAPAPPPLPPSATAPEPDFTVPDPLAGIIPAPAARPPILQDVPDRRMPILQDVPDRDPFARAEADAIATLPAVKSQSSDPFAAPPLQVSPSPSLPPSPSASVNARNASPEPPLAASPERVAGSTPAAGTSFPQTITGSNVQTGTEMPVPDEPTVASPGGDLAAANEAITRDLAGAINPVGLDSRATTARMASDSVAAQSANEPSPGGLSETEDYRGTHRAPTGQHGEGSMDAMDRTYPADLYSREGARYYGDGNAAEDAKIHRMILAVKGKPDAKVTVYRSAPKGKAAAINAGDWVTPSRYYAEMHGDRWDEGFDVLSKEVRAGDLFTEGNSLYEFGYSPQANQSAPASVAAKTSDQTRDESVEAFSAAEPEARHSPDLTPEEIEQTGQQAEQGRAMFAKHWGAPTGVLPELQIAPSLLKKHELGKFHGSRDGARITLRPHADAHFTMAHELAHHRDHQRGSIGSFASEQPRGKLKKVMDFLMTGSATGKALNKAARAWKGVKVNSFTAPYKEHAEYLARPEERFARAIEQATRLLETGEIYEGKGYLTRAEIDAILPLLKDVFRVDPSAPQGTLSSTASTPENRGATAPVGGGLVSSEPGRTASSAQEPGTADGTQVGDPDEIKLTHATVDARREARGAEPIPHGGQGTIAGWKAEAAARLAAAPGAAPALVSDLIAKNRAHDNVEYFMLENYAAALDAEIAQTSAVLADPLSTPEAREQAAQRKLHAEAERDRVEIASALSGSRAGAALGSRRNALARGEVPPLANMVADITLIQDPSGQTPLPPEERAEIEKVHAEMSAAKAKADKKNEQGSRDAYHTELERLLKEAQAETEALRAAQAATAGKPAGRVRKLIKSWIDDGEAALDELRDLGFFRRANMGLDPTVLGKLARVARGWLARGLDITAEAVKNFGDGIREHLPAILKAAQDKMTDGQPAATVATVKQRARAQLAKGKDIPATFARNLALAHIADHLARKDHTLSAEKIAALVQQDLAEFIPGVTLRDARDAISGYGKATYPSKDEARKTLRDLAAQMQKITQIEALRKQEPLLKSGPQRDPPSARQRELTKLLEELKRETGYESRSREDELKSIRDRIKTTLENQIEDLQRVLSGKARPAPPRERLAYDAELQALATLRNSLKELAAEMPEHKLASEARRNKAALKSAQASEAEWNRRAKAQEWKRPGKPDVTYTAEVEAARAAAKTARANFEALKKAANPANDPEAVALRNFKNDTQRRINELNRRMREGEFDPPKKTKREIKHDADSLKLQHALHEAKRKWVDMKLAHTLATMSLPRKAVELLRKVYHTMRAIMTGGEFSGLLRQGFFKTMSHPWRVLSKDLPAALAAFRSEKGEFGILQGIHARANAINGRYKKAKLAIYDPADYSSMLAEGNARSAWANKIPFIAGTGRAYTALLAHMRADLFDMMIEKLERSRGPANPLTDSELTAIADFVNDSTGSGKLGLRSDQRGAKDLLGAFIFSPAFVASRFRLLFGASAWGGSAATRKAIGAEYLKMAAGTAAFYALLAAMQDDDDEEDTMTDPRSGGFMKPRFGQTSVDFLAGLAQISTLIARAYTGETVNRKGQVKPLRGDIPYGADDMLDVLTRFGRSKLSPGASFALNRLTGKDYSGEQTTLGGDLMTIVKPMTYGSLYDIWKSEPARRALPLSAAAMLGLGTQTMQPRR